MANWICAGALAAILIPAVAFPQAGNGAPAVQKQSSAAQGAAPATPKLDPEALPILKGMFQYLASQKSMHIVVEDCVDKVTGNGKVVTLTHRREAFLQRPGNLHMTVSGDEDQEDFYFDGTKMVMVVRDDEVFAQKEFTGTVDQMLAMAEKEYGIRRPLLTLLRSDAGAEVEKALTFAEYLGDSTIDGHECAQLLLSNDKFDFQVWIDRGAAPVPRRLTIHYRGFEGEPRYTLRLLELSTSVPADSQYKPASLEGMEEIAFEPTAEKHAQ